MFIQSSAMPCFSDFYVMPSSLIPTLLELVLVFILLLELVILYLTSIIVKCFVLHPPCLNEGQSMSKVQLPKYFSHARRSGKSEKLPHLLLPGDPWKGSISPAFSTCSSSIDEDSSTHFHSSSTHSNCLSQEDVSCRSFHLKCQRGLTKQTHCIYCHSLPFQGSVGQLARKRKLTNIIVEEFPNESGVPNKETTAFIGIERQSSPKVFPEDTLANHLENHKGSLEEPFSITISENLNDDEDQLNGKTDDKQSLEGEVGAVLSSEITFQPGILEDASVQSGLALKDTTFRPASETGGLVLDNSVMDQENQEYELLKRQSSKILSVVSPGEYSLLMEKQETEMAIDVQSENGDASHEFENDLGRLRETLNAQRKAVNAMYLELEQQRNASALAASKTMALITQLQEEKAALQTEARQFQRIAEEKAIYDQESIDVLKDILLKREAEELALQKEMELYRQRILKDRFEVWGKTKRKLDGGRDRDKLEGGDKVLLLKQCSESKSSEHEDDQGHSFVNTAFSKEDLFGKSTNNLPSTSSQSHGVRGSLESSSRIDAHDVFDAKYKVKQQLYKLNHGNSLQPVMTDILDNEDNSSDGKHDVDSTHVANSQLQQSLLYKSSPIEPVSDSFMTAEENLCRKLDFNGENKWQIILQQLAILERQVLHLSRNQYPELSYKTSITDNVGFFSKDLLVEGTQSMTESVGRLRCKNNQEDENADRRQEYSLESGVKDDYCPSFKSPIECSLACDKNGRLSGTLEFCAPSAIRQLSGISEGSKIESLSSSLQPLKVDRELMHQSIESAKGEGAEAELLQEIADQLRKLHSFILVDSGNG